MSNMIEYAKSELKRIGSDEDGMQNLMNNQILEMIKTFSEQGHSGFSASYAIRCLDRLLRWKPITPLTGEDDEWSKENYGCRSQQNLRCSSVFKCADGTYEDNDAVVVSDNGGITWFSSGRFRKKIEFPYVPPTDQERVYIEYKEDVPLGETGDEYEIITDNPERIKALYERMRIKFDEAEGE